LRFDVTIDTSSLRALYAADTAPAHCDAQSRIELDASLQAEGGEVFSGTGPAHVSASAAGVGLSFVSRDFSTTLHPAGNPCATAGLVMNLSLDSNCRWHGEWNVSPALAVVDNTDCADDFAEPLGVFSARGDCSMLTN
jgi:hypothetical protein